jgi:hypothetical protein
MNPLLVSRIIAAWIICIGGMLLTVPYDKIGPNPTFIILGIAIDTMQKYLLLCTYVIMNIVIRNMNFNIISPWLIQNVQNTNVLHVPVAHAYQIAVCFTLYGWIDSIIYINVILSQFDIILLEIVTDVIINTYITRMYLINKDKL